MKSPNLQKLLLNNCKVGNTGWNKFENFCQIVAGHLSIIDLSNNCIGNIGLESMVKGLINCKQLEIIHLESIFIIYLIDNMVHADGMKHIASLFLIKNNIKELYLEDNLITENGLFYLNEAISKCKDNSPLEVLNVKNNLISCEGVFYITPAMTNRCFDIKTLNFDCIYKYIILIGNMLNDQGMANLRDIFYSSLTSLEVLSLQRIYYYIKIFIIRE